MSKIIEVIFDKQLPGEAGEMYLSISFPKKAFIRKPVPGEDRVVWLSTSKWVGGHEPDAPVKSGSILRVVNNTSKTRVTLFEEEMVLEDGYDTPVAGRKEDFSYELLDSAAREYTKKYALRNRDDWAHWLQKEAPKYGYDGYSENWLYFGTEIIEQKTVVELVVIGVPYALTETLWQHKVCDKKWKVLEIVDAAGQVIELCGYDYTG